jgi:hypothetical protein
MTKQSLILTFSAFLLAGSTALAEKANTYDTKPPIIHSLKNRSSKLDIDESVNTEITRSLADDKTCQEETVRLVQGLTVKEPTQKRKQVALKNCFPEILQAELISAFGRCPRNERGFPGIDNDRRSQNSGVSLTEDCACQQTISEFHQKHMINPLHVFNGPPYSKLDETRGCSLDQLLSLLSNESDQEKARSAFAAAQARVK